MVRAYGANEKERVARAIHKLKDVVHAVVPPAVLSDGKKHKSRTRARFFMGIWRGKEPNQTDKGAIGVNKVR